MEHRIVIQLAIAIIIVCGYYFHSLSLETAISATVELKINVSCMVTIGIISSTHTLFWHLFQRPKSTIHESK